MKNSKIRRALLLLACAVLLVSLSVGATLAYLTSTTQTVKNTFTVGKVNITLDEAKVDLYGVKDGENRTTTGNEYKLLPGHTYTKDPTVTVVRGSEKCYVRVQVTVNNLDNLKAAFPQASYADYYGADGVFLLEKLVKNWDSSVWQYKSCTNGTYEFWYVGTKSTNGVVDASAAEVKLEALFTDIVVPGTANEAQIDQMDQVEIAIVAHAIQADGFANAEAAWDQWGKTDTVVQPTATPAVDPAE